MTTQPLDVIFSPSSIAVVGASRNRGKIGYEILHNLILNDYQGTIYPVNPKARSVHGIPAYPSVLSMPGPVDLAIITVPVDVALAVVEECGRKGVRGLVVITAGFREVGGAGIGREERLLALCREYGMTMVGPNCMGVINTSPDIQMDATFAPTPPLRGGISLVTQSGALGVAILDHAKSLGVGFAKFCSLGNKAQVSLNDVLAAWKGDPETKIILAYIENFGNPKNFVRIARDATKRKPVIAMKSGRSEAGGRAAMSHTGSLGGSDLAAEAVFNQTGVLRANSIEELFDYAMAFARQSPPKGKRVAIVTDAGGPAIMCTDALIQEGMELATLKPQTIESMRAWAAPEASLTNPVDLIASAGPEEYRKALDAVLADDHVDAAIAIYVPPIVTFEVDVAKAIWETAAKHDKPVLCNFLGRSQESPGFVELVQHSIPSYLFPESAAKTIAAMHRYGEYLKRPEGTFKEFEVDRAAAERGAYVRLSIVPAALAGPEGAIVAAFERADIAELDPMAEIVGTGVDPERAFADFAFAVRVARRAGTVIQLGAGPLVVAPDLDAGVNSDPVTRAGRALALQLIAVSLAERFGLGGASVIVGALPVWLIDEPNPAARAVAEVAVRRALLPEHKLAFVEPAGADGQGLWAAIAGAVLPGEGTSLVLRRGAPGPAFAPIAAATRAAADVARELDAALGRRTLDGIAREHAAGSIASALRTLERLGEEGWTGLTGAASERGGWGRLGGEAVAPDAERADPLERALG